MRVMRGLMIVSGIRNLALLEVMNYFYFCYTGERNRFRPAEEFNDD